MSFAYDDYVFELPKELIAQHPSTTRDASRLMVAGPNGEPEHLQFREIARFLKPGDALVLNQTRVMKARCFAQKETGTRIEVFILNIQVAPEQTPVLLRPAKRVKEGAELLFPNSGVRVTVTEKGEMGKAVLAFPSFETLQTVLEKDGELPLPPYIKREDGPDADDAERYQTVYAHELGAVAAPTAGLHFTPELLSEIEAMGVKLCYVTHHVGIGTFKPLVDEDVREHQMEAETYTVTDETAATLNQVKAAGGRVIAVGTTSTRCLESNFRDGRFHAETTDTNCYIYPGYQFGAINGLVTNFHLPGSSLILLVSALMGRERMMDLYKIGVARQYRFYSYGDAMLLLPLQA